MKIPPIERYLGTALIALSLTVATPLFAAEDESADAESAEEDSGGFFDDIREGVSSLADEAVATVPDVPSGAVIAFNRDECPLGWSPFPPADGRVIIGLDTNGDERPLLSIGEPEAARQAAAGDARVSASLPWLALLYCEKD